MNNSNNDDTIVTHFAEDPKEHNGAVVAPIYQNTLFTFDSWEEIDNAFSDPINSNIYTRGNNPSATIPEKKLAKLAGGEKSKLFSSGMAAITSAIMYCVKFNDHIITIKNIYGPTMNFIDNYLKEKLNVSCTFVQGDSLEEIQNAITTSTSLIYLESPSSSIFSLQDIKSITELAKKNNIKTIIDNTWATPIYQKPLKMGVDLEVHSCTKYIGGHSDVIAGVIIGSAKDIDNIFMNEAALFGAKISPFEAWLITRSLRTLPLRMEKHQSSALKVAKYLESHPKISQVFYPGLESSPQHELAKAQMSGFSGLMGIEINCNQVENLKKMMNSLKLFSIGVSWGGHESLFSITAIPYLKEMTLEQFKNTGLSLGIARLSVGLENPDDLIEDLDNALNHI